MHRMLWVLASLGVAVWSLIAWGAYGVINVFGNLAARNADVITSGPEAVEWLSWGLSAVRNVGLTAVVIVWGLVSLVILAVPMLLSVVLGVMGPKRGGGGPIAWPPQQPWTSGEPRPGYRDVTPTGQSSDGEMRRIEKR